MPSVNAAHKANKPRFDSTAGSVLLDTLRGVAALLVCLQHWRYLFFVDYPDVAAHKALWFIPYLLCTVGHQAVIVFFVLSGYLVGGHILRAYRAGIWSWRSYLLQRLVRLWIVLIPALVIGGILDMIAVHFNIAPSLYSGAINNHMLIDAYNNLSLRTLFGNIFFLQKIVTPVFGSNGPLWSLASEFWYYLLFPLALLIVLGKKYDIRRLVMLIGFIAIAIFVGKPILILFPVWLLGVLLAAIPIPRSSSLARWLGLLVYGPFLLASSFLIRTLPVTSDYALGVATFIFIGLLLGAQQVPRSTWYVAPSRTSASFAYTLYLLHFPLLTILTALITRGNRWQPDAGHLLIGFPLLIFVLLCAYFVATLTEFRTTALRDKLMNVLSLHAKPIRS